MGGNRIEEVIGNNIIEIRKKRNMTQAQLARIAELKSIGMVESGKRYPSVRALLRIARSLGVSPNTILKGTEDGTG